MKTVIIGENDLQTICPNVAAEWDYEANAPLAPQDVMAHSGKKAWWKCERNHHWQAVINSRASGYGCPYCAGQRPIQGETDLATLFPNLLDEWDLEANAPLTPQGVTARTNKKVWWKCERNHHWQASVNNRTRGTACPFCSGKKPIVGETDLATLHPELAEEWDDEANAPLTPQDVTSYSEKKVWWKCQKDHHWQAKVKDRARGRGCPYCTGQRPIQGETDLATLFPNLSDEWDYEANAPFTPQDMTTRSKKKMWWKCQNNHQWQAAIKDRTNGSTCPFCSGRRPIVGKTDLATLRPKLIKEWDYETNAPLTPRDVTVHSGKKVWWRCERNHRWQAAIANRANGHGCPYCSGQKPILGETDLATVFPDLSNEWYFEANAPLTPQDVTAHSGRRVWWECQKGHHWQAAISSRASGNTCPFCSGKKPVVGETDLATLHPKLAEEWNYEANAPLSPQDVTAMSNKKVWWKCERGHSWQALVSNRSKGAECPYCTGRLPVVGETDLATLNPKLAEEWDYETNAPLTPQDVLPGTEKQVGWICNKCGNRWKAKIYSRSAGNCCPVCHGIGLKGLQQIEPNDYS